MKMQPNNKSGQREATNENFQGEKYHKILRQLPNLLNRQIKKLPAYPDQKQHSRGISSHGQRNIRAYTEIRTKQPPASIVSFRIGKPTFHSMHPTTALVGTETYEDSKNYLMTINTELFFEKNLDPIIDAVPVEKHVRDSCWAGPQRAVVGLGEDLAIYSLDENFKIKSPAYVRGIHADWIRALDVRDDQPHLVATGSFDGKSLLFDLSRPEMNGMPHFGVKNLASGNAELWISSLKWGPLYSHASNCVCGTTDQGTFFMHDKRTYNHPEFDSKFCFHANTRKTELFAHTFYGLPNVVLLGYGDGEFAHMDMRMRKITDRVKDYYVPSIGHLDYNHETNGVVVSGTTDISIYKHVDGSEELRLWTNKEFTPTPLDPSDDVTYGVFLPSGKEVLVTESTGYAHIIEPAYF